MILVEIPVATGTGRMFAYSSDSGIYLTSDRGGYWS